MDLHVDIRTGSVTPPPPPAPLIVLKRAKKWGDEDMVKLMAADTNLLNGGNFQAVQLSTFDTSGRAWFGAVSQFQKLTQREYDYLRSIQYDQTNKDPKFGTVDAIMNWLVNHDSTGGRPYFMKNGNFVFGTIVFGGQVFGVESNNGQPIVYKMKTKFPAESTIRQNVPFYKIHGFRVSDMGRPITELMTEGKLMHGTAANHKPVPNTYSEYPRGTEIFHPVWDARDWPHNETSREPGLYIAAWLCEDV